MPDETSQGQAGGQSGEQGQISQPAVPDPKLTAEPRSQEKALGPGDLIVKVFDGRTK
jgi:hypothetical protein